MLVASIADQLGNQMFAYASVKTIAQNMGEEFYFVREHNSHINDNDPKYGNELQTIFPNVKEEYLEEVPPQIKNYYREVPRKKRKTIFHSSALQVPKDTLMIGHYISYQYFSNNLKNVRLWFQFPEEIETMVQAELSALRQKYPRRPLVAVHFRVGDDYVRQGFRIRDRYWFDAANEILSQNENPVFLLFYDSRPKKGGVVNRFIEKYDCEICRGSLIHDLCMMSKCEKQIICNSSFSIMSAILNCNSEKEIFRPSVYPVGLVNSPTDCFAPSWRIIQAHQSTLSRFHCILMHIKGKILRVLSHKNKEK